MQTFYCCKTKLTNKEKKARTGKLKIRSCFTSNVVHFFQKDINSKRKCIFNNLQYGQGRSELGKWSARNV